MLSTPRYSVEASAMIFMGGLDSKIRAGPSPPVFLREFPDHVCASTRCRYRSVAAIPIIGCRSSRRMRVDFHKTLYGQVLIATIAGVVFGHYYPSAGTSMRPLG